MKRPAQQKTAATRVQVGGDRKEYLFGKALYLPGGRFGPRLQPDFQLVVIIRGSLRVTVDGVAHDLVPGQAILEPPGVREFFRFSPETNTEHTWCQVSARSLSPTDRRLLRAARGAHQAPSSVHLLIEEGLAVANQSAELHYAMAALARACLLRFAAQVLSGRETASAPPHPALRRALEIATADYARLRSAGELARRVGISASRLRRLFHDARSESPSVMIWRLKVEHAIQLIRSTGLTLGEIADDCGYANPFHLSRAVRRRTGHSPRHLRQSEWSRRMRRGIKSF